MTNLLLTGNFKFKNVRDVCTISKYNVTDINKLHLDSLEVGSLIFDTDGNIGIIASAKTADSYNVLIVHQSQSNTNDLDSTIKRY